MYVIGKTGTGKSTLLKTMVLQDIAAGRGLALLDPHGDLSSEILAGVPAERRKKVIHLDTPSANWTFNPLSHVESGLALPSLSLSKSSRRFGSTIGVLALSTCCETFSSRSLRHPGRHWQTFSRSSPTENIEKQSPMICRTLRSRISG